MRRHFLSGFVIGIAVGLWLQQTMKAVAPEATSPEGQAKAVQPFVPGSWQPNGGYPHQSSTGHVESGSGYGVSIGGTGHSVSVGRGGTQSSVSQEPINGHSIGVSTSEGWSTGHSDSSGIGVGSSSGMSTSVSDSVGHSVGFSEAWSTGSGDAPEDPLPLPVK